jgi:hypothetical protein
MTIITTKGIPEGLVKAFLKLCPLEIYFCQREK